MLDGESTHLKRNKHFYHTLVINKKYTRRYYTTLYLALLQNRPPESKHEKEQISGETMIAVLT